MITSWTKHWIFYHIVFWLFTIFSFCWDLREYAGVDPIGFGLSVFIKIGLLALLVYTNLEVLIPHLYGKSKVLYWLSIILLIAFFILTYRGTYFITTKEVYEVYNPPAIDRNFGKSFIAIRYLIFSMLFNFLRGWFDQEKKINQIHLTQVNTELKLLRAQVNPHFLFNTLNNLYSLAIKKSDKTPELILRLSDMMGYMLSESSDSQVLLQKDVDNILNYLEIERIRQGNNAIIEMKVKGDYMRKKIAPLLLMPLVENAIKHGINTLQNNAYLKAELIIKEEMLELNIKNNYFSNNLNEPGGIGIKNLKSRLELLYPKEYSLEILKNDTEYSATLKINRI